MAHRSRPARHHPTTPARAGRLAALGALLTLGALDAGCSRSAEPCMSAGTCPAGQECLANRCVAAGGEPVPADSQRLVLEPTAIAVLGTDDHRAPATLPPTITFGSAHGASTLLLAFPSAWRQLAHVEAAFLILEPMAASPPSAQDVLVHAHRVHDQWRADSVSWLAKPGLAPPHSTGIARSAPPSPLRVDVTELLRFLRARGQADHGLALTAAGGNGAGASFATGASGGHGPRLEVYGR